MHRVTVGEGLIPTRGDAQRQGMASFPVGETLPNRKCPHPQRKSPRPRRIRRARAGDDLIPDGETFPRRGWARPRRMRLVREGDAPFPAGWLFRRLVAAPSPAGSSLDVSEAAPSWPGRRPWSSTRADPPPEPATPEPGFSTRESGSSRTASRLSTPGSECSPKPPDLSPLISGCSADGSETSAARSEPSLWARSHPLRGREHPGETRETSASGSERSAARSGLFTAGWEHPLRSRGRPLRGRRRSDPAASRLLRVAERLDPPVDRSGNHRFRKRGTRFPGSVQRTVISIAVTLDEPTIWETVQLPVADLRAATLEMGRVLVKAGDADGARTILDAIRKDGSRRESRDVGRRDNLGRLGLGDLGCDGGLRRHQGEGSNEDDEDQRGDDSACLHSSPPSGETAYARHQSDLLPFYANIRGGRSATMNKRLDIFEGATHEEKEHHPSLER